MRAAAELSRPLAPFGPSTSPSCRVVPKWRRRTPLNHHAPRTIRLENFRPAACADAKGARCKLLEV
eukprot:292791-Chlamydomonas_euryale.AAC.10